MTAKPFPKRTNCARVMMLHSHRPTGDEVRSVRRWLLWRPCVNRAGGARQIRSNPPNEDESVSDAWTRKFSGFSLRPMDRNQTHWRLAKGSSVVDYWPSTERWRDLATGLQGIGAKQLTKHVASRQALAEQPK